MATDIPIIHHKAGEWEDSPFRKPKILFGGPVPQPLPPKATFRSGSIEDNWEDPVSAGLRKAVEQRRAQNMAPANPEIPPQK
jgi:hypothetical protein